jgi:hypothetical protein
VRGPVLAPIVLALLVGGLLSAASVPPAHADDEAWDAAAAALLEQAVSGSNEFPHSGELTVASFGEGGPQITEVVLTRGIDGGMSIADPSGREFGRIDGEGFLRSAGTLLRLGGIERLPVDLDRLHRKYGVQVGGTSELDTGSAVALEVTERATGVRREVLHVDDETGLVVRRETFAPDGSPLRVVAFTRLRVAHGVLTSPDADGLELEAVSLATAELADLRARGFVVPEELPHGYELLGGYEVEGADVPTLHLVYADGLYTLSVFQQQGRLSSRALDGATELRSEDGGAVWRWPGSEPRRVIWSGDGLTFTGLTDAPVDELLTVVSGLPNDPPPSMLDRLTRGITRVGRWLWPLDRSAT